MSRMLLTPARPEHRLIGQDRWEEISRVCVAWIGSLAFGPADAASD